MRQVRTALALLGATLCTLAGVALPASTATAGSAGSEAGPTTPAPKKLFTIRDERIQESSGLAKSVKHPGTYWTVNDSGDTGRVFALDANGKVEAVLRFGAKVTDVEALGVDRDGTLYIADIGDNEENRDQIEIYTIPEPETLEDQSNVKYHRYRLQVPGRCARRGDPADRAGDQPALHRHEGAQGHRRDLRGAARTVP